MKGRFSIIIGSKRIRYKLEIDRKITIIKGQSGTGKSTFYQLIKQYVEDKYNNQKSSVFCKCDLELVAMPLNDSQYNWVSELSESHGKIYVIDEGAKYIYSNLFARCVNTSDNYFIVISRGYKINNIAYSVNSIVEFKSNTKKWDGLCKNLRKVYRRSTKSHSRCNSNRGF